MRPIGTYAERRLWEGAPSLAPAVKVVIVWSPDSLVCTQKLLSCMDAFDWLERRRRTTHALELAAAAKARAHLVHEAAREVRATAVELRSKIEGRRTSAGAGSTPVSQGDPSPNPHGTGE